ncbi:MAG: hypothetical protein DRH32_01360 [Deltaproteobacteria bacterium]|nr:MAG: hypothetical protein DRH32_01360 [Deltaproteobacteria bacterium]
MNSRRSEYVLGIWDGHDAGAALLCGDRIVFAVNEERLSRRKLEVGFPRLSIRASLDYAGIRPADIGEVALSTSDPAKTLTRLVPGLREEYYLIRRRKKALGRLDSLKKRFKYRFTEKGPNFLSIALSRHCIRRELRSLGFSGYHLTLVDHHLGHARAAACCSGFGRCLVITLDGVGDGLCGSISQLRAGRLLPVKSNAAGVSPGIFFEHVTNLMNMRELEDEGKVMALADYAYPVADVDNPLMNLIRVQNLDFVSPFNSVAMYREMKKILWRFPSEQFACMAQRALEKNVLQLIENAVAKTGEKRVALSGGVFSNIKLNMKIADLPDIRDVYVFPHMGDGGLAAGAAMVVNHTRFRVSQYKIKDFYLGPDYSGAAIEKLLKQYGFRYQRIDNAGARAARLILDNGIILWFRGRMELGPRALGNRSILARPDSLRIRDRLNLVLKKRVWYQPFCPSLLIEDAPSLLHTNDQDLSLNRFMTTGFKVRQKYRRLMQGVMNIDGTCRPQFVADENPAYRELLLGIRNELGRGVVLNTSFNIHGEPVVDSPEQALDMLTHTGLRYLFIEDFLVENHGV